MSLSNPESYDIALITEENEFKIMFGGNGDLYWVLRRIPKPVEYDEELDAEGICQEPEIEDEIYNSFYISKENPLIYKLFDELYSDVMNCNIFQITEIEREMYSENELKDRELELADLNEWNKYKRDLLVEDDKIKWHSDEQMFEYANIVTISKQAEGYLLEFAVPEQPEEEIIYRLPYTISIRFRNSGSTYDPFNVIFMRMYQELRKYDQEVEKQLKAKMEEEKRKKEEEKNYHQITLDEYKLSLRKKD